MRPLDLSIYVSPLTLACSAVRPSLPACQTERKLGESPCVVLVRPRCLPAISAAVPRIRPHRASLLRSDVGLPYPCTPEWVRYRRARYGSPMRFDASYDRDYARFGITSDRLAVSVVAAHQDHLPSTCRGGRCRSHPQRIPTAHCAMRVPDVRVFLRRSCDVTGPRGELLRREAGTTSLQPSDRNWLLCSIVLWEIRFWKMH